MGAYGPSSVTPHKNVLLPVEAWDSEPVYTELSVVFHNGSLWVAAADNENSEPSGSNADWTLAVAGMPSGNASGLPWDAAIPYVMGDVVIWQGGTWQATGANTNSEPISGNTDWTLVAGTPFVDVVLDPVALTTAPFHVLTGYTITAVDQGTKTFSCVPTARAGLAGLLVGSHLQITSGTQAGLYTVVSSTDATVTVAEAIPTTDTGDTFAVDGLEVLPAPGPNLGLRVSAATVITGEGGPWGAEPQLELHWFNAAGTPEIPWGNPLGNSAAFYTDIQGSSGELTQMTYDNFGSAPFPPYVAHLPFIEDKARYVVLNVQATANSYWGINTAIHLINQIDMTLGGTVFGTRSLLVRLYYQILPGHIASASTFFTITAVNTTAKLFTVAGDAATSLGATFEVTGSTANDGTYTKVSATHKASVTYAITGAVAATKTITIAGDHAADFPAGGPAVITASAANDGTYSVVSATFTVSTAIVVAEVLPANSAASGDIGHGDETLVVVSDTVGSGTADGWIEVA